MRKVYIVSPQTPIDNAVIAAADAAGATEIVQGISPRLARDGVTGNYPFTHTEPDDPERPGRAQAIAVLRNTFRQTRTPAQINNTLDALTLLLKLTINELRDLS